MNAFHCCALRNKIQCSTSSRKRKHTLENNALVQFMGAGLCNDTIIQCIAAGTERVKKIPDDKWHASTHFSMSSFTLSEYNSRPKCATPSASKTPKITYFQLTIGEKNIYYTMCRLCKNSTIIVGRCAAGPETHLNIRIPTLKYHEPMLVLSIEYCTAPLGAWAWKHPKNTPSTRNSLLL